MSFKNYVLIEKRICSKRNESLLTKMLSKVREVIQRKVTSYHNFINK